jgi:methionyl-tRNA formyltransferase
MLEEISLKGQLSRLRRLLRQLGVMPLLRKVWGFAVKLVCRRVKQLHKGRPSRTFADLCERVIYVEDINQSQDVLSALNPDLIVLGEAKIVNECVIRIPRIGILNAHPGLLPKHRGVDATEWAILTGDRIGVTVHFVDEGIDTGPIVIRKTLEIGTGDRLFDLKEKISSLGVQMLVEATNLILAGKALPQPQRPEDGVLHQSMPRALRKEVERKIARRGHRQEGKRRHSLLSS